MELLCHVIHSNAGYKITDETRWLYDAHILAVKLFNHLGTLRYLWQGTVLPPIDGDTKFYVDHSSVSIVVRAAFENYLCFYYIYADATAAENLKKLRHNLWRLRGFS